MIRTGMTILIMLFVHSVFAQENAQLTLDKTFELHSRNSQQEQEIEDGSYFKSMKGYYAAVVVNFNVNSFDEYRFMNQRRTINFTNSDVYMILYSAQELSQQYGKPIPLNTIQSGQPYSNIVFNANTENHTISIQTN